MRMPIQHTTENQASAARLWTAVAESLLSHARILIVESASLFPAVWVK